jgi:hypothetical protein
VKAVRAAVPPPRERGSRGHVASSTVFCLVLLGLTLGALAHVAVHAKQVEVGLALGKERAAHDSLLAERRHLEIELGRLKDPVRLVRMAQEMGMTPEPEAIHTDVAQFQVHRHTAEGPPPEKKPEKKLDKKPERPVLRPSSARPR